jgi:hypothetical protein
LDSFGGIRTFQWVTTNSNKKSLAKFYKTISYGSLFTLQLGRPGAGSPGSKKTIAHIPIFDKKNMALIAIAVDMG